eukprot:1273604-Amorphochlora_amoeboformis.AAC.1
MATTTLREVELDRLRLLRAESVDGPSNRPVGGGPVAGPGDEGETAEAETEAEAEVEAEAEAGAGAVAASGIVGEVVVGPGVVGSGGGVVPVDGPGGGPDVDRLDGAAVERGAKLAGEAGAAAGVEIASGGLRDRSSWTRT